MKQRKSKIIYLIPVLLLLTACTGNICFKLKETPGWVDYFYANRTEHKITGDNLELIVTSCGINGTTVMNETSPKICAHECVIDNEKWQCPENKCCEPGIVDGMKMGVCK